ncbi:gamma-aminobutyric acid receptor subunit beta-like [Nephila pilipes]|uniref:Gamma-aminobutyric acid receptor subunit beta-like n=1 Tax=Nephila pilipes TaxID=299642 RepID=A0A8X6QPX7_NEPPI|nr:gamma-aminobutyric acid receptor subunit beta-like [Nephila pilipes]
MFASLLCYKWPDVMKMLRQFNEHGRRISTTRIGQTKGLWQECVGAFQVWLGVTDPSPSIFPSPCSRDRRRLKSSLLICSDYSPWRLNPRARAHMPKTYAFTILGTGHHRASLQKDAASGLCEIKAAMLRQTILPFMVLFLFFSSRCCEEVVETPAQLDNVTDILKTILEGYDIRLRPDFGGEPLLIGMDMVIASFDSISEVNMVRICNAWYLYAIRQEK